MKVPLTRLGIARWTRRFGKQVFRKLLGLRVLAEIREAPLRGDLRAFEHPPSPRRPRDSFH